MNKLNLIKLTSQEISTPLGSMLAVATEDKLCLLEFHDRKNFDRQIAKLIQSLKAKIEPGDNDVLAQLQIQMDEYFAKTRQCFSIPLLMTGTAFQQSAWQTLLQIAYGDTVCYQQQATTLNRPKAVRAVANANGCNKVSIVIPCHRVIGKNGSLTGYAGKIWRKQFLLDLEQGVN